MIDRVRELRVAGFVTVAAALALAGHVAGGGARPGVLATVIAVAVPLPAALALVRRRRPSAWDVVLGLAAVQLVAHEAIGATGPAHHRHTGTPAAMIAGHVLAVLVAGALLAHGDAAAVALAAVLSATPWRTPLAVLAGPPAVAPLPASVPPGTVPSAPAARPFQTAPLVRRGPPAVLGR